MLWLEIRRRASGERNKSMNSTESLETAQRATVTLLPVTVFTL